MQVHSIIGLSVIFNSNFPITSYESAATHARNLNYILINFNRCLCLITIPTQDLSNLSINYCFVHFIYTKDGMLLRGYKPQVFDLNPISLSRLEVLHIVPSPFTRSHCRFAFCPKVTSGADILCLLTSF